MYESYYGFEKKPFSISPDPDFLYLNENYREAMALLRYGVYDVKGIVSLIGEVGTGKTMLLNELLQSFDDQVIALAIPSTKFSHDELVEYLLARLGVSEVADRSISRLEMLRAQLEARAGWNESVVLLVDEAQTLDRETLESLRLLSNVETPKQKLLPILLVGQPELQDKLDLPELRQFKQRIIVSFRLRPLASDEVPQYIAHRLKGAGYAHGLTLFSDEALRLVSAYTGGIPRLINALCDNALLSGYAQDRHRIDMPIIEEAAKDLVLDKAIADTPPAKAEAPRAASRPAPATKPKLLWVASVILLVAVVAGYFVLSSRQDAGDSASSDRALTATNTAARFLGGRSSSAADGDVTLDRAGAVGATPITDRSPAAPAADFESMRAQERKSVNSISSSAAAKTVERTGMDNDVAGFSETTSFDEGKRMPAERLDSMPLADGANTAFSTSQTQTEPAGLGEEHLSPDDSPEGHERIVPSGGAGDSMEAAALNARGLGLRGKDGRVQAEPVSATNKGLAVKRRGTSRAIKQGQTISSIARELYGDVRLHDLALIHAANPNIKNLDLVFVGQKVFFPDPSQELIIFNPDKGIYGIVLGAARSRATIKRWQADLVKKGVASNIVPVRLSNSIQAYRLDAGEFKDESLAHQEAGVLMPSFKMTIAASREEQL